MSTILVPSRGSERESVPRFPLNFWKLLAVVGISWLVDILFQYLPVFTWSSFLCVSVSTSQIPVSLLLEGHKSLDLGPLLIPGRSQPEILHLIRSTKTLFPSGHIHRDYDLDISFGGHKTGQ